MRDLDVRVCPNIDANYVGAITPDMLWLCHGIVEPLRALPDPGETFV